MRYHPIFVFLIGILSNVTATSSTTSSLFTNTATTAEQTTSTLKKVGHSSFRLRDRKVYRQEQDDSSYAIKDQPLKYDVEPLPTRPSHESRNGENNPKQLRRYDQERRPQSSLLVGTKKHLSSTKETTPAAQEKRRAQENSVTKLFSTPINEWSLEQFALFLVLIMFIFILFGCVCCGSCCGGGRGGGSGCCADILACWCCYECCCDEGGAGIPYGVFA